jgi:AP-3 complex subunit mu
MIQSLFLLSPTGQVLIERHFRGQTTSRRVCDAFWNRASERMEHHGGVAVASSRLWQQDERHVQSAVLYDTVPPVMEVATEEEGGGGGRRGGGGTVYVISILRDGLSYLAVCPAETSPLAVIELLHRIADTFQEYFNNRADEQAIKENFSTVYQLLEEMIDYGWPLTTEINALKAMIRPPTVMSKLLQSTDQVSDELPSGAVSNMPWRLSNPVYAQNEIYVDITEEVDAILDTTGAVVQCDVSGSITCQSRLSGVPDLLLTFSDPTVIDDCSFHPCVRYARYEKDSVVSFVPPDGNFTLMRYRIRQDPVRRFQPPVSCHAVWHAPTDADGGGDGGRKEDGNVGSLTLQAGVTSLSSLVFSASARGKGPVTVEDVSVTIPFPKGCQTVSDFRVNMGTILYDEAAKVARWDLGNMSTAVKATLSCRFAVDAAATTTATAEGKNRGRRRRRRRRRRLAPPNLSLGWKIPLSSVSGISVSGLSVMHETYRPYKGVRNVTKSGLFQVRCSG